MEDKENSMNASMTEEEKFNAVVELIGNGATIKDIKGMTDEQMEAIYSMGCNFYNVGRLDDAENVFKCLLLLNHLCQKYWVGMGAVQQVKRDFQKALSAYEYAALLDVTQPKAIYHAAECYMALGRLDDAEATLDALEQECQPNSDFNRKYLAKGVKLRQLLAKVKAENDAKK